MRMKGLYRKVSTLVIVCLLYMCLVSVFHFSLQARYWHNHSRNDLQLLSSEGHNLRLKELQKLTGGEHRLPVNQSITHQNFLPRNISQTHQRQHPHKSSSQDMSASGIGTNTSSENVPDSRQPLTMRKLKEKLGQQASDLTQEYTTTPGSVPTTAAHVSQTKVDFLFLRGYYIYGIFLDKRYPEGEYIRILTLQPTLNLTTQLMCQFHNTRNRGINVKAEPYEMCENHGKKYGGWIYSCPVPGGTILQTVSLLAVTEKWIALDSLEPVLLRYMNVLEKSAQRPTHSIDSVDNIRQTPIMINGNIKQISKTNDNMKQTPKTNYIKHISRTNDDIKHTSRTNDNIKHTSRTNDIKHPSRTNDNLNQISKSNNNIKQTSMTNDNTKQTSKTNDNIRQASITNNIKQTSITNNNIRQAFMTSPQQGTPLGDNKNLKLGVCVPPLHGDICLSRIINFIEMCRLLGADKVILYIHDIPMDILAFLQNYTGLSPNILSLVLWDLPMINKRRQITETNQIIWNYGQLLAVQHCLYTNMPYFDWLLFIDIDEMLIPQTTSTWPELLSEVVSQNIPQFQRGSNAGISFESAFFQQDFQTQATNSINYFQYLHRTKETSSERSKLFVQPFQVFELGIHHLSRAVSKDMNVIKVVARQALLHHYRQCVPDYATGSNLHCEVLVKDETILRYEPQMTVASREVITSAMEFFAQNR